jgi:hypothetical protein
MTALERSALTAAFMAAVVAAGLTLSLVLHVEFVTLVVFASGIALGSGRGALVGGVGMTLYVFANSAVKGFPPSPLPLLAAQALGMTLPGIAGGWWRRLWLRGGAPRRSAFLFLPVLGGCLAALYQIITNLAFAAFMSDATAPRVGVFLSGMTFGLLDILSNTVIFALAGPSMAGVLRRLARDRGWWERRAAVFLCLWLWGVGTANAQLRAPTAADSTAAPADTLRTTPAAPVSEGPAPPPSRLRHIDPLPEPLWTPTSPRSAVEWGWTSFSSSDSLTGMDPSRPASPALAPVLDPWGLGWGRVRWSYDGFALRGPVHGFDEPPDLPLAWRGKWAEHASAAGAEFGLVPFPKEGSPESQITITTGGYDRRTTEFGLFRVFGSVAVGADFLDRIEKGQAVLAASGLSDLNELDHTRFWLRLSSTPGRRPDWSVDGSTGGEDRKLADGGSLKRASRRVQASLRGPFWGGDTRIGAQFRRQTLQVEGGPNPFDEVTFDGFTLQADWAGPFLPGLSTHLSWDRDRRKGLLAPETFDGVTGRLVWTREGRVWGVGADAALGTQEPYGRTWNATVNGRWRHEGITLKGSLAHEEDLPALVVGVDRPAPPLDGLEEALQSMEHAVQPEERSAMLLETDLEGGFGSLMLQGWVARTRHYRLDNNPLWSPISSYAPIPYPSSSADFTGVSGRLHIELWGGFYGEGRGRVQSRDDIQVPYQARWSTDGALHWRGVLFNRSLNLDAAVGGLALGTRRAPFGTVYPAAGTGYVRLQGRVDNGVLTLALENALDAYLESDLRSTDFLTPYPVAGRTFYLGLTFYLQQ